MAEGSSLEPFINWHSMARHYPANCIYFYNICFVSFKFVCYFQLLFILAKIYVPLGAEGEAPPWSLYIPFFPVAVCSFHGVKWDPVPGHLPVSLPPASSSAGSQEWGHSPASRGCCSQAVPSSCHPFSFDPVYLLPPNSSCLQPRFFCWASC